ncbi:MAG TPA: hypothetical protein VE757_04755 [Gaiellaceae bacterium]|nr:hypothetical protein [Gaiellaceae bacterium]
MNKIHAAAIALLLAASTVLGVAAATRTTGLGRTASIRPSVSNAGLAARSHRLDRIEVALRRSLRSRPPKLPPVPAVHKPAPVQSAAPVAAAPQRVVYQRPPPVVVVKHRAHGDDHESGDGGGGADD